MTSAACTVSEAVLLTAVSSRCALVEGVVASSCWLLLWQHCWPAAYYSSLQKMALFDSVMRRRPPALRDCLQPSRHSHKDCPLHHSVPVPSYSHSSHGNRQLAEGDPGNLAPRAVLWMNLAYTSELPATSCA